jgi:UDP-N-acetylmuramoyl-tripeptide--D-alanyl-D-alanine ligase
VDGHDFAGRAVAAGATGVLAARPVGVPAVVVGDVQAAFGRLATALVDRLPGLAVVGVTGSVGKTTTKDLLGQVLARLGPTTAPPGNRNNELGVPETVSLVPPDGRFLVCELGARHVGDIAYLAGLVRPEVGIVTNVGASHLAEFGSIANTTTAKAELVAALPADGLAVLNADDERVAAMARRSPAPVVTVGLAAAADVRAERVRVDDTGRASFTLQTPSGAAGVSLRLCGEHYVPNALAAAAATLRWTGDVDLIADALSAAERRSAGRMRVAHRPDGVTVIDDAYNASPASVAAALRTTSLLARGRRAVAVLGQMNELGPTSPADHAHVGAMAAAAGVDLVVAVGNADAGRLAAAAARDGARATHVPDSAAAIAALRDTLSAGDIVLIKGSNGVGLSVVAQHLTG